MEPEQLDSRAFRAIAKELGVTTRTLELWRSRGLLPSPTRQPTGRAVWLYPRGTERQLERLVHWRGKTRSLSLISIALWIEGFPIDVERIRTALGTVTEQVASELNPSSDIPAFIDQQARKLAGARGKKSFPRLVKMKADERVRACGYLLAVALDAEDEIERREDDAVLVERMLGLRSGQGGGLASHEPFVNAVQGLRPVMSVEKVREALAAATHQQLELTRLTARLTSVWMPLVLPEILAEHSASQTNPLRKLAEQNSKDPAIEAYVVQIVHQLLAMHERQPKADELDQTITALESVRTDLEMLNIFPAHKHREILSQLPAETRNPLVNELRRRAATVSG
ncbi:MAG TPA: MerR family transcriptional regulator [Solirubrobacteraceae bacterium]|jgi:DNA-binding transcriptional MerR regulator|nr:MerR family transcriptional regulator [Solirubrobacteraceae bacterium]